MRYFVVIWEAFPEDSAFLDAFASESWIVDRDGIAGGESPEIMHCLVFGSVFGLAKISERSKTYLSMAREMKDDLRSPSTKDKC